jgi:hypothetical protein
MKSRGGMRCNICYHQLHRPKIIDNSPKKKHRPGVHKQVSRVSKELRVGQQNKVSIENFNDVSLVNSGNRVHGAVDDQFLLVSKSCAQASVRQSQWSTRLVRAGIVFNPAVDTIEISGFEYSWSSRQYTHISNASLIGSDSKPSRFRRMITRIYATVLHLLTALHREI